MTPKSVFKRSLKFWLRGRVERPALSSTCACRWVGALTRWALVGCFTTHLQVSFAEDVAHKSHSILTQSQKVVTATELTKAVTAGLDRVAEFEYLKLQAKELGIRVWLFGGTAASYAHYAKWDHLRESGEENYNVD